jgi:hypothetical protein
MGIIGSCQELLYKEKKMVVNTRVGKGVPRQLFGRLGLPVSPPPGESAMLKSDSGWVSTQALLAGLQERHHEQSTCLRMGLRHHDSRKWNSWVTKVWIF